MAFCLQPYRRIQIYHQLKLQAVIERCHIKGFFSGLVIHNLDINLVSIYTGINPVDLSAPEAHLIGRRAEVPGFKLSGQRPDRTLQHPFDPHDHVFIAGAAVEHAVSIIGHGFFHTFINICFSFVF